VLSDQEFVADLERFLADHQIVGRGQVNSLAQTTLLLTCPGIPDIYQGTELWDLSLVDPDNRRPVSYGTRRRLLADLAGAGPEQALARAAEGAPKLWLIRQLLGHRRRYPGVYGPASGYEPLPAAGRKAGHALAFTRTGGLVVVVPRLVAGLNGDWDGTSVTLPDGTWTDVLTGAEVSRGDVGVAGLLARFPVAVLGRDV
jgi:(1->4)-alpha-D-glucan 1-alpha-D-glucosylmutase